MSAPSIPQPVADGAQAPDQSGFSCFDFTGRGVDRGRTTYSVPVAAIETASFDGRGKGDAGESAIRGSGWRRVKRWLLSQPDAARTLDPGHPSPHDD